jgi:orotidine-5'-phosphate decarboxylase
MNPYEKIIIALDYPDARSAMKLVRRLKGVPVKYKVGMELGTAAGVPQMVKAIQKVGGYIFLDQKFKDIGNTVKGAARAAAGLGVDMFNIHASMKVASQQAAMNGAKEGAEKKGLPIPKVIGVTLLTDHDYNDLDELGIAHHGFSAEARVMNYVMRLGFLIKEAGLDGAVCSPKELPVMRYVLGPDATIVTPGIQPAFMAANEQKRVTTPAEAIENGASMMVIGRAITQAKDPVAALDMIAKEINDAMPNWGKNKLPSQSRLTIDNRLIIWERNRQR